MLINSNSRTPVGHGTLFVSTWISWIHTSSSGEDFLFFLFHAFSSWLFYLAGVCASSFSSPGWWDLSIEVGEQIDESIHSIIDQHINSLLFFNLPVPFVA